MIIQILLLKTGLPNIYKYLYPLVGQRIMQTAFQIYLLKNEGKASKSLWTAKYIYSAGCYSFLTYYFISRRNLPNYYSEN